MKIIPPLIAIVLLLQISCSKRNDDLLFLNGEWSSDSLKSKKSDQWKEFLYFKDGKLLAHTTWWGKNYLINENQDIVNNQFKDKQGNVFNVKIIDSLNLEITGTDYYANFTKDPSQPNNIISTIKEFKNSQINREILYGKYRLVDIKRRIGNIEYLEDPTYKELLKSKEFDKIIGIPTEQIDYITIDNEKFSISTRRGAKIPLTYIVNPESIDLYSGDVIYKLNYKLYHNTVTLENYDRIGIFIDFILKK